MLFCFVIDNDLGLKLQMRELTEPPQVWNAREAFMEQVHFTLSLIFVKKNTLLGENKPSF